MVLCGWEVRVGQAVAGISCWKACNRVGWGWGRELWSLDLSECCPLEDKPDHRQAVPTGRFPE